LDKAPAEQVIKDIRRATRRHFSAEDKIRIVLEGLRGEESIADHLSRIDLLIAAASPMLCESLARLCRAKPLLCGHSPPAQG